MDTDTTTIDPIEEAFATTPPEVLHFMSSKSFTVLINAIAKALNLSDTQKTMVEHAAKMLVLGLKTVEDIAEEWKAQGVDEKLAVNILYAINVEILSRAAEISTFFSPTEEELKKAELESTQTISQTALETMGSRFTQSAVIAPPMKRDVSLNKTPTSTTPPASADLYREPIDL